MDKGVEGNRRCLETKASSCIYVSYFHICSKNLCKFSTIYSFRETINKKKIYETVLLKGGLPTLTATNETLSRENIALYKLFFYGPMKSSSKLKSLRCSPWKAFPMLL